MQTHSPQQNTPNSAATSPANINTDINKNISNNINEQEQNSLVSKTSASEKVEQTSSQKLKLAEQVQKRRTFAIIAHPDAGKTTLTEKLLLYGGAIHLAGHVRARKDRKSTQSDWMSMEKERGISVSTAALQFVYNDFQMNLLDTPGHQDFSEDTYRTLMAVDCAIMLLDAARGVEPQTIKLFHICQERNIPIFTFINKMDLPALNPFELLDNVEKVLGIAAVPLLWPMGSGKQFAGVYDLQTHNVHRFKKTVGGAFKAPEKVGGTADPELAEIMENDIYREFTEGIEIAENALPPFDREKFLQGKQTPLMFGSAVTNFGIELLLKKFIDLAPSPSPALLQDGTKLSPTNENFSAFVFKLQANMNKAHRDRVAFIRVISGVFERGMSVNIFRAEANSQNDNTKEGKEKKVRLSSPVAFFGQGRSTIDTAYAGDIIGLINPGLYRIGDILFEKQGQAVNFLPLPRFAPEMFARLLPTDTSKSKQFKKGLQELAEEGVVQIFNAHEQAPIIGVVGNLQFEVFQFRLQDEYGAPSRLEKLPYECSRWFDEKNLQKFSRYDMVVRDIYNKPVVLFESQYRLQSFLEKNPQVELRDFS